MSLAALIAVLLGASLTVYGTFAGADLGAGLLDLLAGARDAEREAIAAAIGPTWEANHVWLIFSITILFAAFPAAFSALGGALLAPLTIALIALVLRSAALGLRAGAGPGTPARRRLNRLFGGASLLATVAFGTVAGGLAQASSAAPPTAGVAPNVPWTGMFAWLTGALAAALCGQLAASFVAAAVARSGEPRRAEPFRRRGLQFAALTLLLSLAAPALAAGAATSIWTQVTGDALPIVIVGLGAGGVSLLAFWRRSYRLARGATLLTGAALLWGWFVIQNPRLIGPRLTIHSAAAPHAALAAVAIAGGIVLVLVLPAMYLLFAVFARPELEVIDETSGSGRSASVR